jgi:hypothetical protein
MGKRTCKFCVEALGKTTGTGTKGKSICISPNPARTVLDPAMRAVIVNSFIIDHSTSQVYWWCGVKGRRKKIHLITDSLINQSIGWWKIEYRRDRGGKDGGEWLPAQTIRNAKRARNHTCDNAITTTMLSLTLARPF